MPDPALFAAGFVVFAICVVAAAGAFQSVRRHERDERRIESEARQMAARRQAFQASQRPPAPRRPIRLPVGPGVAGHAAIVDLRNGHDPEQHAA